MSEHRVWANANTFKTIQRSGTYLYASSTSALYFPYLFLKDPAVCLEARDAIMREQVYPGPRRNSQRRLLSSVPM
jgi:hypothetical protein